MSSFILYPAKNLLKQDFVNNSNVFSLMPEASHVYRNNSTGGCSTLARVASHLVENQSINI